MFPEEFFNFGYIEIDQHRCMIHVYKSRMDYQSISISHRVAEAYWSGRSITVVLESGAIQIHRDFYSFPEMIRF
jgi:hypothetical protein